MQIVERELTDDKDRPFAPVEVANCGELVLQKKPKAVAKALVEAEAAIPADLEKIKRKRHASDSESSSGDSESSESDRCAGYRSTSPISCPPLIWHTAKTTESTGNATRSAKRRAGRSIRRSIRRSISQSLLEILILGRRSCESNFAFFWVCYCTVV